MEQNVIKVGFCVAYDWRFLNMALPLIYNSADQICLSVDESRRSWTNRPFDWDAAGFDAMIKEIDKARKVTVYEDNFHVPDLSAKENEVRQRTLMSQKMGKGGWHIQLDCDEFFLDFSGFVKYLRELPPVGYKYNVSCPFLTLFKKLDKGFLYVYPEKRKEIEFFQVATRDPLYQHGRRNGYFNIHCNYWVIHQSWARGDAEIFEKLQNWGHVHDFDSNAYFQRWRSVNHSNYQLVRDLHPIQKDQWRALKYIEAESSQQVVHCFRKPDLPRINTFALFLKNSRLLSRLLGCLQVAWAGRKRS
jgi:hypothetical protein